jgi:chemotaxis regulatin CheY-phosphate phosphatase CheZ
LNGPVVNPTRVGEVVQTQAQVDDLLESLGF